MGSSSAPLWTCQRSCHSPAAWPAHCCMPSILPSSPTGVGCQGGGALVNRWASLPLDCMAVTAAQCFHDLALELASMPSCLAASLCIQPANQIITLGCVTAMKGR